MSETLVQAVVVVVDGVLELTTFTALTAPPLRTNDAAKATDSTASNTVIAIKMTTNRRDRREALDEPLGIHMAKPPEEFWKSA
jgi:hypothetical protein